MDCRLQCNALERDLKNRSAMPINYTERARRLSDTLFLYKQTAYNYPIHFGILGGVHSQEAGAGLSQIDLEACE